VRTIYKYPLEFLGRQDVALPVGAEFLSVQMQRDSICMWFIVDPEDPKETRTFFIVGTGHAMPPGNFLFLGTVQMEDGRFIWHIFSEVKG